MQRAERHEQRPPYDSGGHWPAHGNARRATEPGVRGLADLGESERRKRLVVLNQFDASFKLEERSRIRAGKRLGRAHYLASHTPTPDVGTMFPGFPASSCDPRTEALAGLDCEVSHA